MSRRLGSQIRNQWMGALALFLVLTGGTAFATHGGLNTIGSGDIINGEVKTADIGLAEVKAPDIGPEEVHSGKLRNGAVIRDKLASNAVNFGKVVNDSLTGNDVDESTLDATSYFAYVRDFGDDDTATMPVAEGIRSVVDRRGDHSYEVIFERSMDFCSVQVTPGLGPSSPVGAFAPTSIPRLDYTHGEADTVGVKFHDARAPAELLDTAFITSATC